MPTFTFNRIVPYAALIALLAGLLLSGLLFVLLHRHELQKLEYDLQRYSSSLLNDVQYQIDVAVELVDSVGALHDASEEVTRDEFHRFVSPRLERYAGIEALVWVAQAPERRIEGAGRGAGNGAEPSRWVTRDDLFPEPFVESLHAEHHVLARLLATMPSLREAMDRARDDGTIVISSMVELEPPAVEPRGFVIFRPVYQQTHVDAVSRRQLLLGHAAGVIRVAEMIAAIPHSAGREHVVLEIYDAENGQTVYCGNEESAKTALSWEGVIHLPRRSWRVIFRPTPEFMEQYSGASALLTLGLSLLLVLLFSYHLDSSGRRARRLTLVNQSLAVSRQQIAQAHREWMDAFDAVSDPMFLHDGEGRIMRANRAYARCAGVAVDNILGQHYWQVFPRLDAPPVSPSEQMGDGKAEEELTVDGRVYAVRYFAIRDAAGKYRYSLHILHDVTGQRAAEQRLTQERERAQRYLDVAAVMMLALDREGNIALLNPKGCEILGFTEAELRGQNWVERFVPRQYQREAHAAFAAHVAGRPESYSESWVVGRSGERRLIAWHNTILRDDQGQVSGTLSSGMDITERHRLEQALREAEQRLQSLFETARDGILVVDLATRRFLMVNHALAQMLGYSEAELSWLTMDDIHPAEQLDYVHDQFARQARGESTLARDIPLRQRDGTILYADVNASPMELDGRACLLGILRDTTERRSMEAELRARQERLTLALQSGNDGLWDWDVVRDKIYYSPRWKALLGLGEGEFGGGVDEWLHRVHPDDLPGMQAAIRMALDGAGDHLETEFRMRHKSGRWLWMLCRGYVVRDVEGMPQRMVGTSEDVTSRREAEERARVLACQLRERLKESECLYRVAQLGAEVTTPLSQLLRRAVALLPTAWQYPETTTARIHYRGQVYASAAFREGPWRLDAPIKIHGSVVGRVEVFCTEPQCQEDEGPFLEEERALIDAVAEQLGQLISVRQSQQALTGLNRVLRALNRMHRMHTVDEAGFGQDICDALVREAHYCVAWIGCHDAAGHWRTVAIGGDAAMMAGGGAGEVSPGLMRTVNEALESGDIQCTSLAVDGRGELSVTVLPLTGGERGEGVLAICADPAASLAVAEGELLQEIAEDIAEVIARYGYCMAGAHA